MYTKIPEKLKPLLVLVLSVENVIFPSSYDSLTDVTYNDPRPQFTDSP